MKRRCPRAIGAAAEVAKKLDPRSRVKGASWVDVENEPSSSKLEDAPRLASLSLRLSHESEAGGGGE